MPESGNSNCVVFTALFDINRSNSDGRNIADYLLWLKETSELFESIVIFHDGSLDGHEIENSHQIRIKTSQIEMFSYESFVKKIIKEGNFQAVSDITFKNAKYSLVQYSKFELAIEAMKITGTKSALWVDAGISRFIKKPISENGLQASANSLLEEGYEMRLEVDLRSNIRFPAFQILPSPVGTCKRVVSGTSFWISREYSEELFWDVKQLLEIWRENAVWDNEQVLLRNLEPWRNHKIYMDIQGRNQTGSVARNFDQISSLPMKISNFLAQLLLRNSTNLAE